MILYISGGRYSRKLVFIRHSDMAIVRKTPTVNAAVKTSLPLLEKQKSHMVIVVHQTQTNLYL